MFSISADLSELRAMAEGLRGQMIAKMIEEISSLDTHALLAPSAFGMGRHRNDPFVVREGPLGVVVSFQYRRLGKKRKKRKQKQRSTPAMTSAFRAAVQRAAERVGE